MDRRPNVLILFTDDQRFDTIAALGNPQIHTPNLDKLVGRGMVFRNAYIMGGTSGAVCMPSRAMLHTGRTLYHIAREGQTIDPGHEMMAEAFADSGYQTFGTGKWHNSPAAFARCFQTGGRIFFGGMSDHFDVPLNHFDPTGRYPQEEIYHEPKSHSSDLFAAETISFLATRDRERPFFAYVSFTAPHDPRDTHEKFHEMYDTDELELPPNCCPQHPFDNGEMTIRDEKLEAFPRTPEAVRKHLAEYYAMISHLDDRIGAVLDALDHAGDADNTIVVFAGDNGLAVGQHGLMGKQNLYDHSVHVPLILAGPGVAHGQSSALCYLLDVYPTLCDLAGLRIPGSVEGKSLAPAAEGRSTTHRDALFLGDRHLHRGLYDGRWKLIEYVVEGTRHTQLFDRDADPWEMTNLAGEPDQAERIEAMRRRLQATAAVLDDTRPAFGQVFWEGF